MNATQRKLRSELNLLLAKMKAEGYGSVRDDYSGRGMFGRTCPVIVTSDPDAVQEWAVHEGFNAGAVDGMGLDSVVYWPEFAEPAKASQ